MEILKALTSHLQSPMNGIVGSRGGGGRAKKEDAQRHTKTEPANNEDLPTINFFDNLISQFQNPNLVHDFDDVGGLELLEKLIHDEENFMANIMIKCLKLCASVFGKYLFVVSSQI